MRSPPKLRIAKRLSIVVVLATVSIAIAVYLLVGRSQQLPTIAPPEGPPAGDTDPEISNLISVARAKVLEDPRSAEAWGFLGKVFLANGQDRDAEVCFRFTEQLDQTNPRWPYFLALTNILTNSEEAIACLKRAVDRCDRYDPDVTSPRLQLATLLIEQGRNEEAEEHLRVVRAKEPAGAHVIYLTTLVRANLNDLRGSVALLRLLTDNSASRKKACTKLAQLHLRLGDPAGAQTWDRMARSFPEDTLWPDAYGREIRQYAVGRQQRFARLERLEQEGRYSEAVELLYEIIQSNESLDKAYMELGNNLVHLAQGPASEKAYEEALRRAPHDAEIHHRLALARLFQGEACENRNGDLEGAKAHYRRALDSASTAVKLNPLLADAKKTLGQIQFNLGQRNEAIETLQAYLKIRPEMSSVHLLLATILEKTGQLADARRHLIESVRFAEPGDQKAKEALELFEKKYGRASQVRKGQ